MVCWSGEGPAREEGGPSQGFAYFVFRGLGLGRVLEDGQKSLRMHSGHFGLRARQIRRPWRIRRRDRPVHSSFGTIEQTCRSIFTGSLDDVSFSRLVRRLTWVSTAKPGTPKPTPRITFAVLRPMPGSLTRSSMLFGTSPPKSSTSLRLAAMIERVLARKNPVGLIKVSTTAGSAAARSPAVGYRLNSSGVTR